MYKKLLLTLFASFGMMIFLNAQTKISGTVKDSNGEPLIGASVQVDGTSEGTTTDLEGDFTIMVSDVSGSLNVSYTGYTYPNQWKKYDRCNTGSRCFFRRDCFSWI